jgi:hypothetical protein
LFFARKFEHRFFQANISSPTLFRASFRVVGVFRG